MPQHDSKPWSSFATKVEVSCFKLKGVSLSPCDHCSMYCLSIRSCSVPKPPVQLQEDYHFCHTSEPAQGSIDGSLVSVDYAIAGVLDGHGGKKAAEFSSKQVRCTLLGLALSILHPVCTHAPIPKWIRIEQQKCSIAVTTRNVCRSRSCFNRCCMNVCRAYWTNKTWNLT